VLACGYNQFQCQTGRNCISQCKVCDGDFDCSDGSDEANCSMYHTNTIFLLFVILWAIWGAFQKYGRLCYSVLSAGVYDGLTSMVVIG